jgi:hypothetical protein
VAGLVGLATALGPGLLSEKRSMATLISLKPDTDEPDTAQAFQYFPETISDNKAVNWQSKEIPGGSLPVYQWVASGERTISFTAQFSSDIDLALLLTTDAESNISTNTIAANAAKERLKSSGQGERNVDVRSAVVWLRQYMLPKYDSAKQRTIPPPKLKLLLPKSGIGLAGGENNFTSQDADSVLCVMTSCDVTWEKFFPSGNPRLASVSLAFAQIPQFNQVVSFPGRTDSMAEATLGGKSIANTVFFGYNSFFRKPPTAR